MRTTVHTKLLPGVTAEETCQRGREIRRDVVYHGDEFIGEVVYVERNGGIEYGWRPATADHSSPLACRVVAVSQLPKLRKVHA
jgi:hypothetical protein